MTPIPKNNCINMVFTRSWIPPEAEGFFLKHNEMLAKRTWMIKGCKHGKVVQKDERINEFFYRSEVVFEVFA